VLIGSVPDKYSWILGVLNMQGSVETGLRQLRELSGMDHDLAFEAGLWHAFIHGFMLQDPEKAIAEMRKLDTKNPLASFLLANLHIKNAESERALSYLRQVETNSRGARIPYTSYLKGEVYLHKGDYPRAIEAYSSFLNAYRGQNYLKDAHYKIGLCYWLDEKQEQAIIAFAEAENVGKESAEADKHAARNLASGEMPSIALTKVRFYTDGGYFVEATKLMDEIDPDKFREKRHRVEWHYRKARLLHKQGQPENAEPYYVKTIELAEMNEWYYAPNACLQLGYLKRAKGNLPEARRHFEKALSYKRHEYKNSIDSKARSALAQLKERR
jgi:tetratricopeptide (TPR) repeat protein